MKTHQLLKLSGLDEVPVARQAFDEFLQQQGCDQKSIGEWKLVITEMMANAITHGNIQSEPQEIILEFLRLENQIILSCQDRGNGFENKDYSSILPEDPFSESGRGLFLIYTITDEQECWKNDQYFKFIVKKTHDGLFPLNQESDDEKLEPILGELSNCYENISLFYQLSRSLLDIEQVDAFLSDIIDKIQSSQNYESIYLDISAQAPSELIKEISPSPNIRTERIVLNNFESAKGQRFIQKDNRLIFPVLLENIVVANLIVEPSAGRNVHNTAEIKNLKTCVDMVQTALSNIYLQKIRTAHLVDLKEFNIATDMQESLLPLQVPKGKIGNHVFVGRKSARQVCGDYVQFTKISDEKYRIALIDVMGKGVSAALLAIIFRTQFQLLSQDAELSMNELMGRLNSQLCEMLGELTSFITCTIIEIDLPQRTYRYSNAGHCPSLIMRDNEIIRQLTPSGPPLGITSDAEYKEVNNRLDFNESLIVVTDGVYEWPTNNNEIFGWEALLEVIENNLTDNPEDLWKTILETIESSSDFRMNGFKDDLTYLQIY